jgi:hypothetical protein
MQPMVLKLNHYNMKRSAMKTLLMIVISVLMISVFGCQKEEVSTKSTGTGLVGKWEWVSRMGGFIALHQTPQSLGYTYWIAFTNDSMYQVYDKNNHLTSSNHFTVINDISIFTTHLHPMLKIDHNPIRSSFEVRNDSLFMSEEVCDGFDDVFIRK